MTLYSRMLCLRYAHVDPSSGLVPCHRIIHAWHLVECCKSRPATGHTRSRDVIRAAFRETHCHDDSSTDCAFAARANRNLRKGSAGILHTSSPASRCSRGLAEKRRCPHLTGDGRGGCILAYHAYLTLRLQLIGSPTLHLLQLLQG